MGKDMPKVCEMCSRFFADSKMFKFFRKRICLECTEMLFIRMSRYIDEERRIIEEKELVDFNQLNIFDEEKENGEKRNVKV